MMIAATVLKGI